MGIFINTEIITEFFAWVEDVRIQDETSLEKFVHELVDNPSSFNFKKTDGKYIWTLKPEILEKNLKPFLEQYYSDMYGIEYTSNEDCKEALSLLDSKPTKSQLNKYLEENGNPAFSSGIDYRYDLKIESERVTFIYSTISLSNEGKISYEEFDQHLYFFQNAIRKTYQNSPLGGGLVIEIY
ncbi:hypothetical protein [Pedobacter nutrimenti]|uniref:hypothetical protein n=1 Tax=Pedobacter nutrimenti TaxID=1241337 RepID=UPI00292FC23C|nr:hypothetical protein [Pedobacter nutrimenti]